MHTSHTPTPFRFIRRLTGKFLPQFSRTAALWIAATALSSAQVVQTLSPQNNGTPAAAGSLAMQITYDVPVAVGTGNVTVTDLNTDTIVATFDITNAAHATVSGNTVTFANFTAVGGVSYNVEAPAGFVVAATGGAPAPGFGFNFGDGIWVFDVVAPDTAAPVVVSTTPQNGTGAAVSSTLSVTYDEDVTRGTGPWTIEVFDVTGNQVLQSFTEANTASVTTLGAKLSITLSSNLAFSNEYRVTASSGLVKDAAGNLSAAITSGAWQFTTGTAFTGGQVVISQVYGGGGNTGAPFKNDYIELYNKSNSPISLNGWSVQYASSTGTSWSVTALTGTIQPGGYFLVQQAAGTASNNPPSPPLPTPDTIGTIGMSGTTGKVALSNSITAYAVAIPSGSSLSDLVGYGSANAFEGTAAAPTLSNTTAAIRRVAGSQDTNDNAADFTAGAPAPRNSASPPFVPGADGSGIAVMSNATSGAGSLVGSKIFPSMGASQSVRMNLSGSFPGATLANIAIDVPADFGTPLTANVVLSGAAAGSGTAVASGQTITISGVAVTQANSLSILINGLTAPNVSIDANDTGTRIFNVRTAASGGTLTALITAPTLRVALPVTDIATLRAVVLPSPKAYILVNQAIVTYVESGNFRNQHYIQDANTGILIDDQPVALGASYVTGNGLTNLVGSLTSFGGIMQFNPIAATANVATTGNTPAPIVVTLADFMASPDTYQSRLVRVNGLTLQDATGTFVNNGVRVLVKAAVTGGFRTFFNADYIGSVPPAGTFDLIAIGRRSTDGTTGALSPRALADIISVTPPAPAYQAFADSFAGGQGPLLDFDNDGVRNGLEYLFGVNSAGFTPTPQIVNGAISWPIDPARTDVGYIVETSNNLVNWNPVLAGNLDLTNPNAVRFVLPMGTGPFFVRIGATFVP